MEIIQGNIWKATLPVMIVITTNSQLDNNGNLIMGAGIALEARMKLPSLPASCGKIVQEFGSHYGFRIVQHARQSGKAGIGIFQTKNEWQGSSKLDLIEKSAEMLSEYARFNADIPVRLNYPGIGMGRLTMKDVLPILTKHFDNVENVSVYYV